MKSVSVLGSTGSIGCDTLRVIESNKEIYSINVLTAKTNYKQLASQAIQYKPMYVGIAESKYYKDLKELLSGEKIEVVAGREGIIEASKIYSDIVVSAIVGFAGLEPTYYSIKNGNRIAIANKEALVCAGELILKTAEKKGSELIPIDSEHNAIFQIFDFKRPLSINKITLTASGGPFLNCKLKDLSKVTPKEAINHPNWKMGNKISIDSATMMNKGLEIIEASLFFSLPSKDIEVLIHPQSIIHGMVEYIDGTLLSVMGTPDMRSSISAALSWPERNEINIKGLNLIEINTLNFYKPDTSRFPALNLARQALQTGGSAPSILNAANEVAVSNFLSGKIGFLDIVTVVEIVMNKSHVNIISCLGDVIEEDIKARKMANNIISL